jgi:hypothetical protein
MIRAICVAALLAAGFALPASAQLSVTVERDRLVIGDVTPGGGVAVLGVVQDFPGDTMYVRTPFLVGEGADRLGEISLRLPDSINPVPRHSVFAAVDLSTGDVALGAAGGTRAITGIGTRAARVVELPRGGVGVAVKARRLSAMLVRPSIGAWRKTIEDGGESDADGSGDGVVVLHPSAFARVIDASSPPTELLEGDVVIAIDTYSREVHVVQVPDTSRRGASEGL